VTEPEAGRKESEPPAAPPSAPAAPGGPSPWLALSGGLQLAAAIGAGTGLGWWLDRRWGLTPWLMLLGALGGFGLGFYGLLRSVTRHERNR
jgi:F0F1-type ATP synthase assembly protein I